MRRLINSMGGLINRGKIKISEINKIDDLEPYNGVWDELVSKNRVKNVELTFDWNIEWFRHCCKDSKLKVLIAEEKNKILGIAPLMVSRSRGYGNNPVNKVEFIAARVSNYADFIISEKNKKPVLNAMCDYLNGRCDDFNEINLEFIPEMSSTMESVKHTLTENIDINIEETDVALKVQVDKTWDRFISGIKRTRTLRMRRDINNIKKLGELSFDHYTDYDSINPYLGPMFKYKKNVLRRKSISNIFEDENTIKFFKVVSKKLSSKSYIDLAVLKLNDHPISFLYVLTFGKTYLINITSFDLRFGKYSPGKMVLFYFLREAFGNGFKEIDFGRGPGRHKYFWTDNEINVFNLIIKNKNGS